MDFTNENALSCKSKSKKEKKQIKEEQEENIDVSLDFIIHKKKKKKDKNRATDLNNLINNHHITNCENDEINSSETENKNWIINVNSDTNADKLVKKKSKKQKHSEIEDSLVLNSSLESTGTKKSKKKKKQKSHNEDAPISQNLEQYPVTFQNVETIQENFNESDLDPKKKKKKKRKQSSEPEAAHDNNIEINTNFGDMNVDLPLPKRTKLKKKSHEVHDEQINELQEKKNKSFIPDSDLVAKKNKKIKQEEAEESFENNIETNKNFDDMNVELVITKPKKHKHKNNEIHEINTDEPVKKKKKNKKTKHQEPETNEESHQHNIEFMNCLNITKRKKDKDNKNNEQVNNFQDYNTNESIYKTSELPESESVVEKKKKKKQKPETVEELRENNIEFNNSLERTDRKKSKNTENKKHEQVNNFQDISTEEPVRETSSISESGTVKKKKKQKPEAKKSPENNNYLVIEREIQEHNSRGEVEHINNLQENNPEQTSISAFSILPPNNQQQNEANLELQPKRKQIKKEKKFDNLIAQIKEEIVDIKPNHSSLRSDSMESLRIDSPLDQNNDSDSDALSLDEIAFGKISLQIQQQKRKFQDKHHEAVNKTREIDVILPNPVAPLHKIESKVSTYPKREETLQMEAICPDLRKGAYTLAEDSLIKKNFKQFCKMHDLPHDPEPFLNWRSCVRKIMQQTDRIRFVQFLGYGLPTRPLYSIYNRFKSLFDQHHKKLGRFTKEEDGIIMEYLDKTNSSRPFSDLAKVLGRQPLAIERRAIKIKAGNGKRFFITPQSATELVVRLMLVTKCKDYEELRDRKITTEEWKQVGSFFEPIRVNKVRNAWLNVIYSKLFVENDTFTSEIKRKVLHLLVKYEEKDWKEVNWDRIGKEIGGLNGPLVYKYFKRMVITFVPSFLQKDLKKILEYLVQEENNLMLRSIKFDKILLIKNVYEQLQQLQKNES